MKICLILIASLVIVAIESKPVERLNEFEATNDIEYGRAKKTRELNNMEDASIEENSDDGIKKKPANDDANPEGSSTVAPQQLNPFPNFLLPFIQKLQFSPQVFFQDRLNQLKESLGNLGLITPTNNGSKQFPTNTGLLQLVGLNDEGFYTDRFEPAGFLGGNGWFANKGGILGGPGALLSTGSLFTDYPTPYKK